MTGNRYQVTGKNEDYKTAFRDDTAIQATHDLLSIVGYEVPHKNIGNWTRRMRDKAEDYAAREHLHASGHSLMRVPCPAFLEKYRVIGRSGDRVIENRKITKSPNRK